MPHKLDESARCPRCNGVEMEIVDVIAGFMAPLPDIVAIECAGCGHTGEAFHDRTAWRVRWPGQEEYSR